MQAVQCKAHHHLYSCMQVRERELHLIGKTAVVKTLNLCLVFAVPPVIALVIFATYAYQVGPLTPAMAFVVLSLFNTLRFPLVVLPKALRGASGRYTVSVPFSCTALCSRQRWQGVKACSGLHVLCVTKCMCWPAYKVVAVRVMLTEAIAAMGRIQRFLLLPEAEEQPAAGKTQAVIVSSAQLTPCCCHVHDCC